jgi:hypothetical protein
MGGSGSGTDGGAGSFAAVKAILSTNCAISGCHGNNGGTMHIDFRDNAGLYMRLTGNAPNTAPSACRNRTIVTPGMPTQSLIVAMIEAPNGPRMSCGARMPDDCPTARPCLTAAQIQTIRDWITAGAPNQ